MQSKNRRRAPKSMLRKGIAVVELAVCLPVLMLIVLATIESSAMIFLQQSLSIAAYEGARVALTPGATSNNAKTQSQQIMQDRDIQDATVTVTPGDLSVASPGDWITIETSAPFSSNSLVGGWLFNQKTLYAQTAMMKER